MSIFTVNRHVHSAEANGTAELLRASRMGRRVPLVAAVITSTVMNVLLGVLTILIMRASTMDPAPQLGPTVLFATSVVATGVTFTGIAAFATQLSTTTPGASGIAEALRAASFVLRGLGDMSRAQGGDVEFLSWTSPLGWPQRTAPFTLDRWWPLLLNLALVFFAARWVIQSRRNLGTGVFQERRGAAHAAAWLHSPEALVFRVQRGGTLAWSLALKVSRTRWLVAWVPLVTGIFTSVFGQALGFEDRLMNTSAFEHVGQIPGLGVQRDGVALMLGLGFTFTLIGVLGFRRRNLLASRVGRVPWWSENRGKSRGPRH